MDANARAHGAPMTWPTACGPGWVSWGSSSRICLPAPGGAWRRLTGASPFLMPDSRDRSQAEGDQDILPGRRAVLEALRAARPLRKILLTRAAHGGTIRAILQEARRHDIFVQFVDERRLDRLAQGTHHQGVIALTSAKSIASVDEILASARRSEEHTS